MQSKFRGVAVSGKAGAGKTTIVNALRSEIEAAGLTTLTVSFAEPVKTLSKAVLVNLGLVAETAAEKDWKYQYRGVPQTVGVHLRQYDPDIWVKLALARIALAKPDIIIANDDCRFRNEAQGLKEAGIFLVRLEVDRELRLDRLGELKNETHVSETDLDDYDGFDLTIHQSKDADVARPEVIAREILRIALLPRRPDTRQRVF